MWCDILQIDAWVYNQSQNSSHTIEAYLIQILKIGFFIVDCHCRNFAIDVDESVIYYDFGIMEEIKSFIMWEGMLDLFYAVYEKTPKGLYAVSSIRRFVLFFLDNLMNQRSDQQQNLAAISEDLFAIALDQSFWFSFTFILGLRAFLTLEDIGYILDPGFCF